MKIIITALFCFCMLLSKSQTDSTKKDSVKTYAVVLSDQEFTALVNILKTADEKPSIINAWINFLSSRAQLLLPPKQELPQKEKPKK